MYYNYDDDNNNASTQDNNTAAPSDNHSTDGSSGDETSYDTSKINDTARDTWKTSVTDDSKTEDSKAETVQDSKTKSTYYEPWREPVDGNQESDDSNAYSPGLHSSAYYTQQKRSDSGGSKPPRIHKHSGLVRAVCLVLVCALVSAAASYGVIQYRISKGDLKSSQVVLGSTSSGSSSSGSSTTPLAATGSTLTPEQIYSLGCEQVVGVNTQVSTNVFGQASSTAVSGSGFIISSDGYILTNYHVIEYAAQYGYSLKVMMHDGTTYTAKVIGYEADNDVAVIKIDATGLNAVTVGSSANMQVGETIYAIGNPLGELDYTMTDGIVSALNRVISVDETTSINMFQINAAVNAGNSGGPVYNSKGEVLGIVSAKYSSTGVEGLGFAIPIDDAMNIASQLITNGHVTGKAYMGVTVRSVSSTVAQYYNLVEGAYVESVESGSCADKAGIKVGDIITKLGDTSVTSADTLKLAKKNYKAGDTASVTVSRSGQVMQLNITFDEDKSSSSASSGSSSSSGTPNPSNGPMNPADGFGQSGGDGN